MNKITCSLFAALAIGGCAAPLQTTTGNPEVVIQGVSGESILAAARTLCLEADRGKIKDESPNSFTCESLAPDYMYQVAKSRVTQFWTYRVTPENGGHRLDIKPVYQAYVTGPFGLGGRMMEFGTKSREDTVITLEVQARLRTIQSELSSGN